MITRKKLKIAQIVCVFPPYAGGIGNATANISKYLVKLGHDVTVFTPAYNDSMKPKESIDGYKVERLSTKVKFGNAAILFQLWKQIREFDIVDIHLPFIGTAEIVNLLRIFKGRKLKIVSHYHMDLFGKNALFKLIFGIEQKMLIPIQLYFSNKIIIASRDYAKNSAIGSIYGKRRDKFDFIPFGVETNTFFPAGKDTRLVKKYHLEGKKVILFVGGLDEAHYFKGVDYLIDAFSKLKSDDYRLIVVGKGNLRKNYEEQAKRLKISNKVIFAGFVPDEDLPRYYNLCDIFVLPSINSAEAFGIVLIEAMACGKPAIASDLPGVREVLGDYQKEISCIPKDSDDLARKIRKILNDSLLYRRISKENLRRAKEIYSWEKVSSRLNNLYLEVIRQKRGNRKGNK